MKLAGRLSDTTLGDVLGTLARARVTGVVRLTEATGPTAGRTHGIHLSQGAVVAVDSQAVTLPLGEILRQRGLLDGAAHQRLTLQLATAAPGSPRTGDLLVAASLATPEVVGAALRQQTRTRLDALFRLRDAKISFHVACAPPAPGTGPLEPREYLTGRPRARPRGAGRQEQPRPSARSAASGGLRPASEKRRRALELLGLREDVTVEQVAQAFRELARRTHPDRFASAGEAARRSAEERFAALSSAYHELVG